MKQRTLWLASAACLATLALIGVPGRASRADCGPGTVGNDVITCDDDPDGVNALTGSDTITVQPGATVSGPVLTLDGGDTITNDGTIAIGGSPTPGSGPMVTAARSPITARSARRATRPSARSSTGMATS